MELGLKDKVVICMSSATGIGKGIATEVAREGAKVVICTAEPFKADLEKAQIDIERATGNRPQTFIYDVKDAVSIKRMIDDVASQLGNIYGLVNLCPGPKAGSGGRILNSTSSSIKSALDNLILSNTFRMGVVGMSKTMAREFGQYGVLINVMGPGRIYTDRIKYLNNIRGEKQGISEEEYTKRDSTSFPQKRYQTVEEYGRIVAFLISPANSGVSGQAFLCDGAMTDSY